MTVARQPLWAGWLLFVLVSGAVAGTSTALLGLASSVGLETILILGMFAASVGWAISLIPGVALYVLYDALIPTNQPKWEYDEAGNNVFLLGALGPSIFLILGLFTFASLRSNPMQRPAISRLFGISTAVSFAGLFLFQKLEML